VKLTLTPGSRVAGRFEIVRFIAEGGMGEVYEARDRELGDRVALKFLSHRSIGDDHIERRFRREIQLARKVTHPNVCRLFDVYHHDVVLPGSAENATINVAFVTMELLEGPTLEEYISRRGRLSATEALPIVVQMCQALQAAHSAGVIHRDFKSNNVMLVAGEGGATRVVVTDFGLARSSEEETSSSKTPLTTDQLIVGTADYMAPEQIHGGAVSAQSDLYALGVVLFEMITGKKPYAATNPMQLLVKRVSEEPANPRDFVPDLAPYWESAILHCMEREPQNRPRSALDVIKELEATHAVVVPKSQAELVPAPTRRALGLTLPWIASLVLIAAWALWSLRPLPQQSPPKIFNPKRVTSGQGLETAPSISPDGQLMVFSGELVDGSFELFIQSIDGSAPPRQLTSDDGQAFEPVWSPDGRQIVYHSRSRGGLWSISPSGGQAERLTEKGSHPSFSPDGQQIAFQAESSPLISDTTAPAMSPSILWLFDIEQRAERPLTRVGEPTGGHGEPSWSPDGRFLIFTASGRRDSAVWVLRLSDRALHEITGLAGPAYDPLVLPDGKRLLVAIHDKEVKDLWEVPIDQKTLLPTGPPKKLVGLGVSSMRLATVSPDGKRLVYSAYLSRSNLWRLDLDEKGSARREQQLTFSDDRYSRPNVARDGRVIAFDHWKLGLPSQIWTLDLATERLRRLTQSEGPHSQPHWYGDGDLVFQTLVGDHVVLSIMDPGNLQVRQSIELEPGIDWALISPDGKSLAYHARSANGDIDVWTRDLSTGRSIQRTRHGGLAAFPCWSPDGRSLAFQSRLGDDTQIFLIDLGSGREKQLTRESGQSWPFSFSPDGTKIAYAGQRNGQWDIYWLETATGRSMALTRSTGFTSYLRYPTWSPKGDFLVFERSETVGDLFVADDFL
jgi:eukaryotic-like serine/threonine-protein kinase